VSPGVGDPGGEISRVIPEDLQVLVFELFFSLHPQLPYLLGEKVEVIIFKGKGGREFHINGPGKGGRGELQESFTVCGNNFPADFCFFQFEVFEACKEAPFSIQYPVSFEKLCPEEDFGRTVFQSPIGDHPNFLGSIGWNVTGKMPGDDFSSIEIGKAILNGKSKFFWGIVHHEEFNSILSPTQREVNRLKGSPDEVVTRFPSKVVIDDCPSDSTPAVAIHPEKGSCGAKFPSSPVLKGQFQCFALKELGKAEVFWKRKEFRVFDKLPEHPPDALTFEDVIMELPGRRIKEKLIIGDELLERLKNRGCQDSKFGDELSPIPGVILVIHPLFYIFDEDTQVPEVAIALLL
jgi:hypothetical protein